MNPPSLQSVQLTTYFPLSLFSGVVEPFFITIVKTHMRAVAGVQGKITPVLCKCRIKPSLASEGFGVKRDVNREAGTR